MRKIHESHFMYNPTKVGPWVCAHCNACDCHQMGDLVERCPASES